MNETTLQESGNGTATLSRPSVWFTPRFDIYENENEYVLMGDLPGSLRDEVLFAGLLSQGAGEPAFADAARPGDDEVTARANPFAGGELAEERTVETAGSAIIDILDAG